MDFLPTSLGTRPRLAVEIRAEGIVAARAENAAALLAAVAKADVARQAVVPGLKAGNITDRIAVAAAVRSALDQVSGKGSERGVGRDVTIVVPDGAVRVLLLDFDQLPSKPAEALPVVRFRLKKLLPFDADTAAVSYQIMSNQRDAVRVLAVATPRDVLDEYESVVSAAGYMPGAVLPSTLAALAGLDAADAPALVVNVGSGWVTTAIVQGGILLLHRSLDVNANAEDASDTYTSVSQTIVDEALQPGGYDRFDAEASMQSSVVEQAEIREMMTVVNAEAASYEVTQAISVAVAYFEDTLRVSPESLLAAGTMGSERLAAMMQANGLDGFRVQEMVDPGMMEAGAATSAVSRGWLAGVRGALKS